MDYGRLRATVMGLGLFGGGAAAARWLARAGALVTVTDKAPAERLADSLRSLASFPIYRYTLGGHREKDFLEADLIVVNPAVPPGNPWLEMARQAGARLTSEIELFLENCPARLIGVTGSNGKSTTAAMIASILNAAGQKTCLGGNIGRSLLDRLGFMAPNDTIVLELSSFQLHRLSQTAPIPETAVITNFTPNHLNWHPDLDHYAAAKQRLLRSQPPHATALFDPSAPGLNTWSHYVQGIHKIPRSLSELPPLNVHGDHNRFNASLATATAIHMGCTQNAVETGLREFGGLPDRLELIQTAAGRRFFNDSSSTTPESTMAALRALERPLWLLAGGADKGIPCDELASCICRHADGAILYGQVADKLAEQITSQKSRLTCCAVKTLPEAFTVCVDQAPADGTILLSPGFSSHDQYANYRERGAAFVAIVKSWCECHTQ